MVYLLIFSYMYVDRKTFLIHIFIIYFHISTVRYFSIHIFICQQCNIGPGESEMGLDDPPRIRNAQNLWMSASLLTAVVGQTFFRQIFLAALAASYIPWVLYFFQLWVNPVKFRAQKMNPDLKVWNPFTNLQMTKKRLTFYS